MEIESSVRNGNEIIDAAIDDEGDAGGFGRIGKSTTSMMKMTSEVNASRYNMSHQPRGCCLIFNHKIFDGHLRLNERGGTNQDRDNAECLFRNLGFRVIVYDNLRQKDVIDKCEEWAFNCDHSEYDCFIVIYMSHGEEGIIFARDASFPAEKLFGYFQADKCLSLAGKPKLFFIQACRGENLDSGIIMTPRGSRDEIDASTFQFKLPVTADFLVCWSTVPGYYSWRNTTNGSWFIQSLVHVFSTEARHDDVLSMMTSVNRYMINNFESNCPSQYHMHGKKQVACIMSTLMRKLYLYPAN